MGYFMDSFGGYSMCTRCTKNTYAPFMIDNDMMMGKKEKLNITTFNISFALINYLLFCIDLYSKYKYNNFGIIIITYYETLQSIFVYDWHLYCYFVFNFELMIKGKNMWKTLMISFWRKLWTDEMIKEIITVSFITICSLIRKSLWVTII